jgi:hypothetical protein
LANRRLKLTFTHEDVSAFAELLDDEAPRTADAIWGLLPLKGRVIHDIWSGPQLLLHLDSSVQLPAENMLIYHPVPGDIFYYYRPPHYYRGTPYGRVESAELGITYARDSRPQGPRGPKAVNLFGTIRENLDGFARVAAKTIEEGSKEFAVERA